MRAERRRRDARALKAKNATRALWRRCTHWPSRPRRQRRKRESTAALVSTEADTRQHLPPSCLSSRRLSWEGAPLARLLALWRRAAGHARLDVGAQHPQRDTRHGLDTRSQERSRTTRDKKRAPSSGRHVIRPLWLGTCLSRGQRDGESACLVAHTHPCRSRATRRRAWRLRRRRR